MRLLTERLVLKSPHEVTAKELCGYYLANREFARAFEPIREEAFYTMAYQSKSLESVRYLKNVISSARVDLKSI